MEKESLREIWEEICFHLSDNVNPNINENVFEQKVLGTLRLLGWSQFRGEIKVKPQLHIGRQNIITPDIVLYAFDNRAVVVLEIKRPSEDLSRPGSFAQLQSYMRQTRAEFGILLGKEIYVYYEGHLSSELHAPLLLSKISFNSDSAKGMEFVDLFLKDNFIARKYEPYLQAHVERLKRERKINIFREQLISENTKSKVLEFLKNEFSSIGNDILTDAIRGISINISYQQSNSIHYDEPESRSETLSVCKNKSSNKYFIYLEDLPNNEFHLVNPEGRLIGLPSDHFEQPKEENLDYLLSYKLITEQQLENFKEYESQTPNYFNAPNNNNHDQDGVRHLTPSAFEWSRGIPELSRIPGLNSWKAICDHFRIDVGGDSARRALKRWASTHRPDWPEIPEPRF